MSLKVFPNSFSIEQNNFDWFLNAMDRFVKGVLVGTNKNHKKRMVEKLQIMLKWQNCWRIISKTRLVPGKSKCQMKFG